MEKELSGPQWVSRFPGSDSISELEGAFRSAVRDFVGALRAAGASVRISATYRPRERAYLMHYSSRVSRGEISPLKVPAMAGVNINWNHGDDAVSKRAANQMANGYGIVFPPALTSRHTERSAIDMTITGIIGKKMRNVRGEVVAVKNRSVLHQIGAEYGCRKLLSDPPHWSDNGR